MKVLITGGAGFIGQHLVQYLLNQTHCELVVIDNLSSVNSKHPFHDPEVFAKWNNRLCFQYNSIVNIDLDYIFDTHKFDAIIHLAAFTSVPLSVQEPYQCHLNNVDGFVNILEKARKYGVKRFIYASSSAVLDTIQSPYALSKKINEQYGELYYQLYGIECIGLRFFNVFGRGQKPDGDYASVIPKFIQQMISGNQPTIYGDGNQTRDFIHVDDVVYACHQALFTQNSLLFGRTHNIGTGKSFSINQVFKIIRTHLNSNLTPIHQPPRAGDIFHSVAEIDDAKRFSLIRDHKNKFEKQITELVEINLN